MVETQHKTWFVDTIRATLWVKLSGLQYSGPGEYHGQSGPSSPAATALLYYTMTRTRYASRLPGEFLCPLIGGYNHVTYYVYTRVVLCCCWTQILLNIAQAGSWVLDQQVVVMFQIATLPLCSTSYLFTVALNNFMTTETSPKIWCHFLGSDYVPFKNL